ncbi:MAG TPA: hypothetical protein VNJ07_02085, partial [Chitinophagales bacterium]|nr:hypothetical protein [Chitinophagales bacterium]
MKLTQSVLATAILSLLLQLLLPWWIIVAAAALAGAIFSIGGFRSFVSGFLGTAVVWWGYAWMIDVKNQSLLSARIAELFHLGNPALLIFVCGLLAGIVGGFASVSG